MTYVVVFLVLLVVLYFAGGAFIHWRAKDDNSIFFFMPAGTHVFITTKKNVDTDITRGGGGVVNIAHEVPGQKLLKKDHDIFNWNFVPGKEDRGLLHFLYGVHLKRPFSHLRLNIDRSFRFGKKPIKEESDRKEGEEKKVEGRYTIFSQDLPTRFIPFFSQQAVEVESAETDGSFRLNVKMDLMIERTYPLRALLRVADANAILSEKVEEAVIGLTGQHEPEYYLYGKGDAKNELTKAVVGGTVRIADKDIEMKGINEDTLERLGITIKSATVFSVDPEEAQRELFELQEKTKRENAKRILDAENEKETRRIAAEALVLQAEGEAKATVVRAEATKKAGMLGNDVLADVVTRVDLPMAESPGGPAIRTARAIENTRLSYLVIGQGAPPLGLIVDPTKKPAETATT